MTISPSRLAYPDCFDAMDRALADEQGIRIKGSDLNHVTHMRTRMHTARSIDRKDNMSTYADQLDHPMYGRSIYDVLVLRIREDDDGAWLYIEKIALRGEVQSLAEVGLAPLPKPQTQQIASPEPVKQIEHLSGLRRL